MPRKITPPSIRFWAKVEKTDTCWLWRGADNGCGYGKFNLGGRTKPDVYAHRFAYETLVGPIPKDRDLDHICRKCRNEWQKLKYQRMKRRLEIANSVPVLP